MGKKDAERNIRHRRTQVLELHLKQVSCRCDVELTRRIRDTTVEIGLRFAPVATRGA